MNFEYELLRSYDGFTDLGVALVYYSALTTYVFDDPYLFKSGKLRELGEELAEQIGIRPLSETWRQAGVANGNQALIYVSEIEDGSLKFWQAVAIGVQITGGVVAMAAAGPSAIKAYKEVYRPEIVDTWDQGLEKMDDFAEFGGDVLDLTAEYMRELFSGMSEIIDMTVLPSTPEPTSRRHSTSPVRPATQNKKRKPPLIRG
ncbi:MULTISPECIES: hypothetical protein [unclassified Mesorhizobium]|uniref:hypothetical protein n=1 Tax=unclassified Mesorhizobium TaxID=325217 RepID=UPI0033397E16